MIGETMKDLAALGLFPRVRHLNATKTLKPFGKLDQFASMLGYTLHMTLLSRLPFYAVRFHFMSGGTASVIDCKASCAVSANNTTPCSNSTGTGGWKSITVGGASTFTVAGSSGAALVADTVSDIIHINSIPRTDGDGYILMMRLYQPSAGNTTANRTAPCGDLTVAADTLDTVRMQVGYTNADAVTTPTSWFRGGTSFGPAVWVELFTADSSTFVPVLQVIGDSTIQGFGWSATTAQIGGGKLWANGQGAEIFTAATSASTSQDYLSNWLDQYATYPKPDIIAFQPWSINDSDSLVTSCYERVYSQAAQFISKAREMGAVPVLITGCPKNGITSGEETVRRQVQENIRSMATALNVALVDRDLYYTDYNNAAGGFLAGLYYDTLHPNEAGYTGEKALWDTALAPVLKKIGRVLP